MVGKLNSLPLQLQMENLLLNNDVYINHNCESQEEILKK